MLNQCEWAISKRKIVMVLLPFPSTFVHLQNHHNQQSTINNKNCIGLLSQVRQFSTCLCLRLRSFAWNIIEYGNFYLMGGSRELCFFFSHLKQFFFFLIFFCLIFFFVKCFLIHFYVRQEIQNQHTVYIEEMYSTSQPITFHLMC